MTIQVWGWHGRGNEVRRKYQINRSDGSDPIIFEIHCTLSKGALLIDMFVNFLLHPGPIQRECMLKGSLTAEGQSPESFSFLVGPAAGGSTIINVSGRQDVNRCYRLFASGKNLTFQLLSDAGQVIVRLSLPNDDSFRKEYDGAYKSAEGGPRDRSPAGDALDSALRGSSQEERDKPRPDSEGLKQPPFDPRWKPIGKHAPEAPKQRSTPALAIVIVPPDDSGYGIYLMTLDEKGEDRKSVV